MRTVEFVPISSIERILGRDLLLTSMDRRIDYSTVLGQTWKSVNLSFNYIQPILYITLSAVPQQHLWTDYNSTICWWIQGNSRFIHLKKISQVFVYFLLCLISRSNMFEGFFLAADSQIWISEQPTEDFSEQYFLIFAVPCNNIITTN